MQLAEVVETSRQVAETRSRLEKTDRLAALLRRLPPPLVSVGVSYLAGDLPQGRLGVGYALLGRLRGGGVAPAPQSSLGLAEIDATFTAVKDARGAGSAARRNDLLGQLFGRATSEEQDFLTRLIIGELRHGALEGIMVDAVARAFAAPPPEVRRATMLAGSLPVVAAALAQEGAAALARFELRLFQPVQPMLADSADDVSAAWDRLGEAAYDFKLDGARVQVHKDGDQVTVFSRLLNDVTPAVPELVELVSRLPARRLILDGEAIALSRAGRPLPFQTTMRRFGRRLQVDRLRVELPLDVRFFDVLRVDDQILLDRPLQERWDALTAATAPVDAVVPHIVAATPEQADAFLARAFAEGHEGVMAKSLSAPYSAGRRGQEWLKIKAAHTLDLVVLAAEWGSGRRQGWLSNLHLGARDPDEGGYVMLGKTFKGMTDETLAWQTQALLARELGRDGAVVHVRPELVAEIAFNDVQVSRQYPGGVALRFARVKRYRPDKTAADANTIADVRALLPAP
ncbi:MAG TPA: ATP-dependent DNA ligase [Polyangia bacterium]|jgi:DNA ligase-1|nr:ATP-dependent DNA ligase [Polyangia bacterium]